MGGKSDALPGNQHRFFDSKGAVRIFDWQQQMQIIQPAPEYVRVFLGKGVGCQRRRTFWPVVTRELFQVHAAPHRKETRIQAFLAGFGI
ncbi:MAG: hypothetical protein BWX80_04220 [Candidatus Hydrogenedentes bacterium ADurb.Bin101]|nr:MAG: hypothetical protein BWX80_04220 [Candidatus Hydrogenedentes bacterium ADurb.Bin101]